MYDYASENLEIKKDKTGKLGFTVLNRFRRAIMWQAQERVGKYSLKEVLGNCYDQLNDVMDPLDASIASELGAQAYINLTTTKTGIVNSFLSEALVQNEKLPWVVKPTPIPDLSSSMEDEILLRVKQQIFTQGFDGDLVALIKRIDEQVIEERKTSAEQAARSMQEKILDQTSEGGWNHALNDFIYNFTGYPFAVLQGPIPTMGPRMYWSGDNPKVKNDLYYKFNSVSPWDFWWSPDSTSTQDGAGVFIRQRWTRQKLFQAMGMKSYISDNVKKVLEQYDRGSQRLLWMSANPEQQDYEKIFWKNGSYTVEVLLHYGYFSGKELREYGFDDLDSLQFYNATVAIVDNTVIQVLVAKQPTLNVRPVFTASFYKEKDRIASYGIPQKLRDVERCYMSVLRYLLVNAHNASGPITEADFESLGPYLSNDDLTKIIPNVIYLKDNTVGSNSPSFRFHTIPSNIQAYIALMNHFQDIADRVTNIPAALHGTAIGTGVNRTFRGAALLQQNSVRSITSSVYNIDDTVFEPLGQLLFNYNMLYESDSSIKGDCQIQSVGAAGLLQEEIDRQNAYEIVQLVAAAGAQIGETKAAQLLEFALNTLLRAMGVPESFLTDAMSDEAIIQQAVRIFQQNPQILQAIYQQFAEASAQQQVQ